MESGGGLKSRLEALERRTSTRVPKTKIQQLIDDERETAKENRLRDLNDIIVSETRKETEISSSNFINVVRTVMRYIDKYAGDIVMATGYALTGNVKHQYCLSILAELLSDIAVDVFSATIKDVYAREFKLQREGHLIQHDELEKAIGRKKSKGFSLRKRLASSLSIHWKL